MKVKVTQSCPTLCSPMYYTVHGILQSRILAWVAFPFSRGSFQPRDQTQVFCITGRFFYQLSYQGSPRILEWVAYPISSGSSWPRNQTGVSCIAGRLLGFRTGVYRQRSTNINKRSVLTKWFFFSFNSNITLQPLYIKYPQRKVIGEM